MKKILIIIGVVITITAAALLGWYFLRNDATTPTNNDVSGVLPFGSGEGLVQPGALGSSNDEQSINVEGFEPIVSENGLPVANLFRLTDSPIAGAVAFTRSGQTVVRYVDRATGHIYEVALPQGQARTPIEKRKITNTTMPKIYEAFFHRDGSSVLLRSLKDDTEITQNISLTLTPPVITSTSTLNNEERGLYKFSATSFRGDITSVAVGLGNTLYYALRDSKSVVTSTFNTGSVRTLFASLFTDWQLASAGNNLIAYTKPSRSVPGYAYSVNTTNGGLSKIAGPLNGLSVMPDSQNTWVFYSYKGGAYTINEAKNLRTGVVSGVSPHTLAEKCVWGIKKVGIAYCGVPVDGVGSNSPDSWYQGKTNFSDRLWQFDVNQEIAQVLVEPKSVFGLDLDVIDVKISPNEDYLIFTNKTDLTLWVFRLPQL